MSRPVSPVPTYRRHKQFGQALVTIRTSTGIRRDVLLGRYNSPESREAYQRVLAEISAHGASQPFSGNSQSISINELLLVYWRHAQQHYRFPDGRSTSELDGFKLSLRPVKELYGSTQAAEFGPRKLSSVRDVMIRSGLSRPVINQRIRRIVRVFKWATAEELVPPMVFHGLRSLTGLRAGRSSAPEPTPIGPVPLADYEATLNHLPRLVRAMVELQRHTGMRPGEVCGLKLLTVTSSTSCIEKAVERCSRRSGGGWG